MSGVTGDSQLFEENFTITNVDQSKFDRVARLSGTSPDAQTVMTLDVNTELFPCSVGENLHCVLTTTLNMDGSKEEGRGWRDVTKMDGEPTLADHYDYVCHGKIYKFEDGDDGQSMCVFLSPGTPSAARHASRRGGRFADKPVCVQQGLHLVWRAVDVVGGVV